MAPPSPRVLFQRAIRDLPIRGTVKTVGWCLSTYMNASGVAWPSMAAVAEGADCSPRTARRALHQLRDLGVLRIEVSRGRRPSRYIANADRAVSGFEPWDNPVDNSPTRSRRVANTDTAVSPEVVEGRRPSARTRARAQESDDEFVARVMQERLR